MQLLQVSFKNTGFTNTTPLPTAFRVSFFCILMINWLIPQMCHIYEMIAFHLTAGVMISLIESAFKQSEARHDALNYLYLGNVVWMSSLYIVTHDVLALLLFQAIFGVRTSPVSGCDEWFSSALVLPASFSCLCHWSMLREIVLHQYCANA